MNRHKVASRVFGAVFWLLLTVNVVALAVFMEEPRWIEVPSESVRVRANDALVAYSGQPLLLAGTMLRSFGISVLGWINAMLLVLMYFARSMERKYAK